jgi:single-strand DNA-binding protein
MFNQWTGIGRLAADPESRFTTNGTQVANFTLCVDSGYGENKKTEFARIVVWSKLAEICANYLKKGSLCMIQGEMQTRQWEDQQGQKKYTTEIVAKEMKMLDRKSESAGGYSEPSGGIGGDTGEDVPF